MQLLDLKNEFMSRMGEGFVFEDKTEKKTYHSLGVASGFEYGIGGTIRSSVPSHVDDHL